MGKEFSFIKGNYAIIVISWILARMRVPKMVKNGHNSILHVSAAFEENKYL
jgi:hypothetical protein